jgi:hypothetical protein
MKTQHFILTVTLLVLPFVRPLAQDSKESSSPNTKYDVHRQYDENGNLIEYDSSSVTTWSSQGSDSLSDYWSYTPNPADSSMYNHERPYHYSFRFPGDDFSDIPHFDFDFDFRDLDSLMRGFNFNFSMAPADSALPPNNPYFNFHGEFPPMNLDVESYIRDMQKLMDDMLYGHDKFFREFNDHGLLPPEPEQAVPDSTNKPPAPVVPKPAPQKYFGPVQNI